MDSTLHDMPAFLDPSYPFLFPYVSHTTADEVEVGSSPSSEAGPRMGVPLVSTSQSTSTNLFPNYSPNTCFNTSTHFHSTIPQDEPNWYTLDENPRFVYQPPYSIADHGDCAWLLPACQTGTPSPFPHHPPRLESHSAEGYQAAASILLSTPGPENQPTGSPTLNALPMIPSTHYSSNIPPSHSTSGPTTSNSRNYLCFNDSKGVTQYQCLVCGRCIQRRLSNFQAHLEIHNPDRERFDCDWPGCNRPFTRKRDQMRHVKADHLGIQPLKDTSKFPRSHMGRYPLGSSTAAKGI